MSGGETGPLPIHFITIVVKAQAIDRSDPGGREWFASRYQPSTNGALYGVSVMGGESVEAILVWLEAVGIVSGADVAVGDMMQGLLLKCPGIAFNASGEWPHIHWQAGAVEPPEADEERTMQERPAGSVERVQEGAVAESATGTEQTCASQQPIWRRHVVPGGVVFWTGGDDDEEEG